MRSIRSAGRNIRSHAVRVLPPICIESFPDKLLGTSYVGSMVSPLSVRFRFYVILIQLKSMHLHFNGSAVYPF